MINALLLFPCVLAGLATSSSAQAAALAPGNVTGHGRPNLLVVLLDDVGVDKIAAYGEHPDAGPTPVIDFVARRGVLFRNAWAMPLCSPARASTLTGRSPARHGIGSGVNTGYTIADDEIMLPEVLRRLDYRSGMVGKWHLAGKCVDFAMHPIASGFDRSLGPKQNIGNYFEWNRIDADAHGAVSEAVTTYATTQQVDDALQLIDEFGDTPWFLWLAFNAPHTPLHVPPAELHTQGPLTGDEPAPVLYGAMLEAADTEIGRLLRRLRPAVLQNTWLVIMGDNGTPAAANTPPFGGFGYNKGDCTEGGINVPLLVYGPGVVPHEEAMLVSCMDLFPTLIELAGGSLPQTTLDGISFLPALRQADAPPIHRSVIAQTHAPNGPKPHTVVRAVRDERFKLILAGGSPGDPAVADPVRFYDLLLDPFETSDLLGAVANLSPEQRAHYEALLAAAP